MKLFIPVFLAFLTFSLQAQTVTTYAGNPQGQTGTTVNGYSSLRLTNPAGIAFDGQGRLWLSEEGGHVIRLFHTDGKVYIRAGAFGAAGYMNASGVVAKFNSPRGIAIDGSGNIYVADAGNHVIRKIAPFSSLGNQQQVTLLAGDPNNAGHQDGTGSNAHFHTPSGVAVDQQGNIYVADYETHVIRKITPAGVVTTFAGTANQSGSDDGAAASAKFYRPYGLYYSTTDNALYVADSWNKKIRKIAGGQVTTVVGIGSGISTWIYRAVTKDAAGNYYIGDQCHILKYDGSALTVFAGSEWANDCGHVDGADTSARFNVIYDLKMNGNELYVLERNDATNDDYIRKVNLVTTSVQTVSEPAVTLYPNPAHDWLRIAVPGENGPVHYEVWDLLGRKTAEGRFSGAYRLDVSSWTQGLYLMKLTNGRKVHLTKFRVE